MYRPFVHDLPGNEPEAWAQRRPGTTELYSPTHGANIRFKAIIGGRTCRIETAIVLFGSSPDWGWERWQACCTRHARAAKRGRCSARVPRKAVTTFATVRAKLANRLRSGLIV